MTRVPNWLRAAVNTAKFTFIGTTGLALAGWLTEVANWAREPDGRPFPSTSLVVATAVSAAASGAALIANAVVRYAQERALDNTERTGVVGRAARLVAAHSRPPVYPTTHRRNRPLRAGDTSEG